MVSSEGVASKKRYFEITHKNDELTLEQWVKLMDTMHTKKILSMPMAENEGYTGKKYIAYLQSIPYINPQQREATIAVLADNRDFENLMSSSNLFENSHVYIVNKEGELLLSSDSSRDISQLLDADIVNYENNVSESMIDNQKHVVSYNISKPFNVQYITTIPESVFWRDLILARNFIFLGIVFIFVVGGVISIYFTRRNYTPIDRLISDITRKTKRNFEKSKNEYSFIFEALDHSINEKLSAQRQVSAQNKILINNFLVRILNGRERHQEYAHKMLGDYKIDFSKEFFAVMLFEIEEFPQFYEEENSEVGYTQEMVFVILSNVIQELVNEVHYGCMVKVNENIFACIVNVEENDFNKFFIEIEEIVEKASSFIEENFRIYFNTVVSNSYKDIAGISEGYYETMNALRFCATTGESFIQCRDINSFETEYSFNIETEHKLINYIRIGDYDNAYDILHRILAPLLSDAFNNEIIISLKFDVVSSFMKALSDREHKQFLNSLHAASRIAECVSPRIILNYESKT